MSTFDYILETSLIYNDMLHFNIIIDCTFELNVCKCHGKMLMMMITESTIGLNEQTREVNERLDG